MLLFFLCVCVGVGGGGGVISHSHLKKVEAQELLTITNCDFSSQHVHGMFSCGSVDQRVVGQRRQR